MYSRSNRREVPLMDEINRTNDGNPIEELTFTTIFTPLERFKLLKLFIDEPATKFNINDLHWRLNQSPPTIQKHLNFYLFHEILQELTTQNETFFQLNQKSIIVLVIRRVVAVWR